MAKAITAALSGGKVLTYTDLRKAVEADLRSFPGSIGWYLITVIRDLESQGRVSCNRAGGRSVYSLDKRK